MLKTLTKPDSVTIEIVTITPEVAQAMLEKNFDNRKRAQRFVSQFASDMRSGNWEVTGDPIKFDVAGNLIDGQHRLMACIEAKKNFTSYVAYGLKPTIKELVDSGKPRTASDVLVMKGLGNPNNTAAALRILISQKRGTSHLNAPITHTQITQALRKHSALPLWVQYPGAFPKGISIPVVSYIAYVNGHILGHKARAAAMVNVLKTGQPDYEGDPIHRLRERVIRKSADGHGAVGSTRAHFMYTIKYCWNLFLKRKEIATLHWQKEDCDLIGLDLKDL